MKFYKNHTIKLHLHSLERDSDDIESYYIDVFNGGRFMTRKSCPRLVGESKCPMDRNIRNAATAVEVQFLCKFHM